MAEVIFRFRSFYLAQITPSRRLSCRRPLQMPWYYWILMYFTLLLLIVILQSDAVLSVITVTSFGCMTPYVRCNCPAWRGCKDRSCHHQGLRNDYIAISWGVYSQSWTIYMQLSLSETTICLRLGFLEHIKCPIPCTACKRFRQSKERYSLA